jgi:hypothetical protein
MAIFRPTPKCPYCGEVIAKAVYIDQSKIPSMMRLIGDTFIRWDYITHTCEGTKKAEAENKKWREDHKYLLDAFNKELEDKAKKQQVLQKNKNQ